MGCTVREAKKRIDYDELQDFLLFFTEHPPLDQQITTMLANVCYAVWEIGRNAKTKRLKPEDWIPKYRVTTQQDKADQATQQMKIAFGVLANGKNRR